MTTDEDIMAKAKEAGFDSRSDMWWKYHIPMFRVLFDEGRQDGRQCALIESARVCDELVLSDEQGKASEMTWLEFESFNGGVRRCRDAVQKMAGENQNSA